MGQETPSSPFGVFSITDSEKRTGRIVYVGEEPASDSVAYAVNGPKNCTASNRFSIYQTGFELHLAYDGEEPTIGDKYGPKAGQSKAVKDGTPALWECTGIVDATNKIMRARWLGGNGLTPAILKSDCAPGDTAIAAYPVASDGTADTTATELSLDNTFPGNCSGRGSDTTGDTATATKVLYASVLGKSQIVTPQFVPRMCWATTNVEVSPGDANFTVIDIATFDGSPPPSDGSMPVRNQPDGYAIANGQRGKIISCIEDGVEVWHPFDFEYDCDQSA